jgi:hypothetical protein
MHGMNPGWIDLLQSIDRVPDGKFVRENSCGLIKIEHWSREIFGYYRRLIGWLNEKVGRRQAARCFFHHHHRVPVMDVRSLNETKFAGTELERFAIAKPAQALGDSEARCIQLDRQKRTDELAPRRRLHESVHPAVLVPFPMQQDDAAELDRIEHLADGSANRLVKMVHPRVNQRGTFVSNEELVKRDTVRLLPGGDPVNSVDDLINARAISVHTSISEVRAREAVRQFSVPLQHQSWRLAGFPLFWCAATEVPVRFI